MRIKKKEKHTRGITLIALVITIIVLLILAGVSIATLTGENGILTQAQNAKNETEEAEAQEKEELKNQNSLIENIVNGNFSNQNAENNLIIKSQEQDGAFFIAIAITNISQELVDNYKSEILNKTPEEKEEILIDLFKKSMKGMLEFITGKEINTEKELVDAVAKMNGDTEVEFNTIKDYFIYLANKPNEEGEKTTYEEYIEEQLSFLLNMGTGVVDVTIENEKGEKIYCAYTVYDSEQKIIALMALANKVGKYKVTAKIANTDTVLTGETEIQKEYEIEIIASASAYLLDKEKTERDTIKAAYVYINNEKKDVSSYIKKDMAGDDYLDYISLYYDGVTNMEVPFDIELISKYDTSARITITEPPVH